MASLETLVRLWPRCREAAGAREEVAIVFVLQVVNVLLAVFNLVRPSIFYRLTGEFRG